MLKKLNTNKPLYDTKSGRHVEILHEFDNGNLVVTTNSEAQRAITVDKFGRYVLPSGNTRLYGEARVVNKPVEKVEYLSLYPDGNVYRKECCPVRNSLYGVENLIQIKVTRRGGKIVKKEFC